MKKKLISLVIMITCIMNGGCVMTKTNSNGYKLSVKKSDANYIAMKKVMPNVGEEIRRKEINGIDDKGKQTTVNGIYFEDYQEAIRQDTRNKKMLAYSEQHWLDIEKSMQKYIKDKYGLDNIELERADATFPYDTLRVVIKHTSNPVFYSDFTYTPKGNDYYDAGIGKTGVSFEDNWAQGYMYMAHKNEFDELNEFFNKHDLSPMSDGVIYGIGIPGSVMTNVVVGTTQDEERVKKVIEYGKANPNATPEEIKKKLTEFNFDGHVHNFYVQVYEKKDLGIVTRDYYKSVFDDLNTFIQDKKYGAVFVGGFTLKINRTYIGDDSTQGYQFDWGDLGFVMRAKNKS